MVRKRKPIIDSFHKWLDAFTGYAWSLSAPIHGDPLNCSNTSKLLVGQPPNSRVPLFWPTTGHFRRQAANDLRISWDQVGIELWTVTFSGLAKPHYLVCSSPHHSQSSCPNADPFCQSSKNSSVWFHFNRSSGCNSCSCPFPHICHRCRSADHSFVSCSSSFSKVNCLSNGSSNTNQLPISGYISHICKDNKQNKKPGFF